MKCTICKTQDRKKHGNSKYCEECAEARRSKPVGKLTASQVRDVKRLKGSMYAHEIAERIGTSQTNLKRWARDNGASLNAHKYDKKTVRSVTEYYAKHGRVKTQERFPGVKVRSIVERYLKEADRRQIRWTSEQLIELAKMGGLIRYEAQAKYFDRPGANAGSVKSAWQKRYGFGGTNVNGLSFHIAKQYVTENCPVYETSFWVTHNGPRKVVLWIDVAKHLKPEVCLEIRNAVKALAKFQRWLHGRNARASILRILEERS